jgi:hypothetical protein
LCVVKFLAVQTCDSRENFMTDFPPVLRQIRCLRRASRLVANSPTGRI